MNRNDSVNLHRKGVGEWNKWASKLLVEKTNLQKDEKNWELERARWEKEATANFRNREFKNDENFAGFNFPGPAIFNSSTFFRFARFENAVFHSGVGFQNATFKGNAIFSDAHFHGEIDFTNVDFLKGATFASASFFSIPDHPSFFCFRAINSERFFSLEGTHFDQIPDFTQAHFIEAPTLSDINIRPLAPQHGSRPTEEQRKAPELWRHLRRLATQAHDHERERNFFAKEVKSQRNVFHFWNGKSWEHWWVGVVYQGFSNFGRSLPLPFLWWLSSTILFGYAYLIQNSLLKFDSAWGWWKFECFDSMANPFSAAVNLTLSRASVVGGFWGRNGIDRSFQCLFGTDNQPFEPLKPMVHLPDWIIFAGYAQTLFSAIMIFLFLLAVRNHFRIR